MELGQFIYRIGDEMGRKNYIQTISFLRKTEGKRRRGWQRMRWLDSITDSMDMNLSKLQKIVKDRGAWPATYSPWGHKELDMTW